MNAFRRNTKQRSPGDHVTPRPSPGACVKAPPRRLARVSFTFWCQCRGILKGGLLFACSVLPSLCLFRCWFGSYFRVRNQLKHIHRTFVTGCYIRILRVLFPLLFELGIQFMATTNCMIFAGLFFLFVCFVRRIILY